MKKFPENAKRYLGELANEREYSLLYVGQFKGEDVYYVNPVRPAKTGFPMMVLENAGHVRIITSSTPEGLECWRLVRDRIPE